MLSTSIIIIFYHLTSQSIVYTKSMQTKPLNIRILPEEAEVLDKLAGDMFTRQKLASILLKAAIRAVRDNPERLRFPPVFSVAAVDDERRSSSEASSRKRKT
jgi:hypothetical protein